MELTVLIDVAKIIGGTGMEKKKWKGDFNWSRDMT